MIDALGSVGSLLLVGGTSDIAVATARRYLAERPLRVVVAARDTPRRAAVAEELPPPAPASRSSTSTPTTRRRRPAWSPRRVGRR